MMNPAAIFKIKGAWEKFVNNHPKFPMFLNAASKEALKENSVIEIKITTSEGKEMVTNLKVTKSDLELFESLKNLK